MSNFLENKASALGVGNNIALEQVESQPFSSYVKSTAMLAAARGQTAVHGVGQKRVEVSETKGRRQITASEAYEREVCVGKSEKTLESAVEGLHDQLSMVTKCLADKENALANLVVTTEGLEAELTINEDMTLGTSLAEFNAANTWQILTVKARSESKRLMGEWSENYVGAAKLIKVFIVGCALLLGELLLLSSWLLWSRDVKPSPPTPLCDLDAAWTAGCTDGVTDGGGNVLSCLASALSIVDSGLVIVIAETPSPWWPIQIAEVLAVVGLAVVVICGVAGILFTFASSLVFRCRPNRPNLSFVLNIMTLVIMCLAVLSFSPSATTDVLFNGRRITPVPTTQDELRSIVLAEVERLRTNENWAY